MNCIDVFVVKVLMYVHNVLYKVKQISDQDSIFNNK